MFLRQYHPDNADRNIKTRTRVGRAWLVGDLGIWPGKQRAHTSSVKKKLNLILGWDTLHILVQRIWTQDVSYPFFFEIQDVSYPNTRLSFFFLTEGVGWRLEAEGRLARPFLFGTLDAILAVVVVAPVPVPQRNLVYLLAPYRCGGLTPTIHHT